jgi:hypothetical protein
MICRAGLARQTPGEGTGGLRGFEAGVRGAVSRRGFEAMFGLCHAAERRVRWAAI